MDRFNQVGQKHILLLPVVSMITLILIACVGCSYKSQEKEKITPDEELYINAKLGFSIILPLNWERINVPVSSPSYRKDSVNWKIPGADKKGRMLIRTYTRLSTATELHHLLEQFLINKEQHSREETETIQHRVGKTIVTTVDYARHKERIFAIHGSQQDFILSFFVEKKNYIEQSPTFEQVAGSLRELQ